jgi:hypothetical protein
VVYSDDFETNPLLGIVTSSWAVDNTLAQAGTRGIHPPLPTGTGSSDEMSITCNGKSHSEVSFYYSGVNPTANQQLKFYVDDVLYATYGNTYNFGVNWGKVDLVVPTGMHKYRWVATTDTAVQSPYWLDTIQCRNTPTVANSSGQFNFEDGFVPPEVGGDFRIDNSLVQAGTFATHPRILPANSTASMYFSCGCKSHGELSFYYTGVNPTAAQTLKFYVDGALNHTYGNTYNFGVNWGKVDIVLQPGAHSYRWDMATDVAGQPPYWLDTITCQ